MSFRAIIPAAGEGRRLKPHTVATPKVLLQVAGKPIIGHIMDRLLPAGPDEVCVVVGAQGDQIRRYLESSYRCRFSFLAQENPRGLGDAVYRARPSFHGSEPALIVLGDTIVDIDMREMTGGGNQLAVREVPDPRRFGIVETEGDRVIRLVEKPEHPRSNLAIVGLYYLQDAQALFGSLERLMAEQKTTRGEYQLTDALQLLLEGGLDMRTRAIEHWLDCGTRDAMIQTNRYLLSRDGHFTPRPGAVILPPVFIHDTATIENSVVGPYVSIGAEAEIRGSVISDSIVNDRVVVEHSLLQGSILGESSIVRDSPRRLNLGGFSELELG
jgi:glucose-1-phosphate thymidylyltransferase